MFDACINFQLRSLDLGFAQLNAPGQNLALVLDAKRRQEAGE